MKFNIWTKTALFAYKYLDTIAEAIDKLVERQALNSFYYNQASSYNNGVEEVSNRIIELSQRKINLINIKVAIDLSLEEMPPHQAQLLIERYIDGERGEDIASRHNFTFRTYFRRLQKAEDVFTSIMAGKGVDEKTLSQSLKKEKWVTDIYKNFLSKKLGEEVSEEQLLIAL